MFLLFQTLDELVQVSDQGLFWLSGCGPWSAPILCKHLLPTETHSLQSFQLQSWAQTFVHFPTRHTTRHQTIPVSSFFIVQNVLIFLFFAFKQNFLFRFRFSDLSNKSEVTIPSDSLAENKPIFPSQRVLYAITMVIHVVHTPTTLLALDMLPQIKPKDRLNNSITPPDSLTANIP
mmetsp:Transcript_13484/g.24146  ORF Transcript_13484/g.24146 Transcript_13484/m.24146 type:complete len:176 (+) Transcript_13484:4609-5136(+)